MHVAPTLLARALDRARADWLAGDPGAWARYTDGLARLEQHYRRMARLEDAAGVERRNGEPAGIRPGRPGDRPPARP